MKKQQITLTQERATLPREIAKLSAEGTKLLRRLTEMEGPGKRFVENRLEEVGKQQADLNERLTIVERDLAAFENMKVEAKWVAQTLAAFSEVWDALTIENRSRFVHAIVDRVVVNEPEGKVEAFLAKFEDAPEDTTDDDETEDAKISSRPNLTLIRNEETP